MDPALAIVCTLEVVRTTEICVLRLATLVFSKNHCTVPKQIDDAERSPKLRANREQLRSINRSPCN